VTQAIDDIAISEKVDVHSVDQICQDLKVVLGRCVGCKDNGDVTEEMRRGYEEDIEPESPGLDKFSKEAIKVEKKLIVLKKKKNHYFNITQEVDEKSLPNVEKRLSNMGFRSLNTFAPRLSKAEKKKNSNTQLSSSIATESPDDSNSHSSKKWPKRPKQMPIPDFIEPEEIDDEWARQEFERKQNIKIQLEKKQKDNQRRLKKRRRLINKANKEQESENLEKVTTDSKGNVLLKRMLNVDMLAPKGSARMVHYKVDKEMSVGRNIYKEVFDTIKKKFQSETSINSHRQIQNYKSLSRTRNDGKNNERILDVYMLKKPKEMTNK